MSSELRDYLATCRDEGRSVFGYGAPARGLILLNLACLDPSLLPFTVDKNVAKQGRLLAGCRIPVRALADLDAARPNVVLVLPWTLLPEIKHQLAHLTRGGTRLVVAMPALRVVEP